jgi:hypothetical protein
MTDMTYVDSSTIEAIGYESNSEELHVQFLSGGYYIYFGVPCSVYDEFSSAPSKGGYFHANIKGVYPYAKQ